MWPAKSGLGAQLTYGVSGNGIIDNISSEDSPFVLGLQFPRSKNGASSLYEIQNSSRRLSSGVEKALDSGLQFRAPRKPSTVSHGLMKAMNAEADPFSKGMCHDPSVSSLSVAFDLGIGKYSNASKVSDSKPSFLAVRCVACVDGADSILLCPLLPKMKNIIHLSDTTASRKSLCAVPNEQYITKCKFRFHIRQIMYSGELLAVRGADEISFLEVSWNNNPKNKGISFCKAFSLSFPESPLLHFEMKSDRLVVLDSKRQCTTYTFWKDSEWCVKKDSSIELPAQNPFDLSNFIRLHWPSVSDNIVIMQRKTVMGISLGSNDVRKHLNFHNWSHLLDFQQIGTELFMLTSQEIIWLRLNEDNDLQRLLSWKHYLDPTDYSLKMTLHLREKDKVIMCLIYCAKSPIIIHYSFAMRGNRPCSVRDPYYIRSGLSGISHISVCSSAFNENDYLMNYFQIGVNYEVDYMALSFQSDLAFKEYSKDTATSKSTLTPSRFIPLIFSQKEERFLLQQFRHSGSKEITRTELTTKNDSSGPLSPKLQSSASKPNPQVDAVQNFAFELGADIDAIFKTSSGSKAVPSFKSLATIAKNIPTTVQDLPELGSMFEQLGTFYEDHNIKLNKGDWRVANQLIPLAAKNSEDLSENLFEALKSYKQDPNIIKAVIILVASIMKANSMNFAKDCDSAIREEAARHEPEFQDIFDEWKFDESLEVKAGITSTKHQATKHQATKHQATKHQTTNHQTTNHQATKHQTTKNSNLSSAPSTQNSHTMSPSQCSQTFQSHLDSQPLTFIDAPEENLHVPSSQVPELKTPHSSQVSHEISSQPKSQPKSQLKRLGSQNPSQRRKKKKGGFA